jgi:hypothetical protein
MEYKSEYIKSVSKYEGMNLRIIYIKFLEQKILNVCSGGVNMENKDFEQIFNQYKQQGEEQALAEVSRNQSNSKEEFVAVRKKDDGDIIAFKTSMGRELDYITALEEAKAGNIAHVDVFHKYGRDIIRSEPDGIKENNLDHLPEF